MSSDARIMTGASIKSTIAGKEYTFAPITLDGWGRLSAVIKSRRMDYITAVWAILDKCPLQHVPMQLEAANTQAAKPVTDEDFGKYIRSPEGLAHLFAEMLGPAHPDLTTVEAVQAEFGGVPLQQLNMIANQASGLAEAKN